MNRGAQGCLGQWAALCDATVRDTGHRFVQTPRVTLPWAVDSGRHASGGRRLGQMPDSTGRAGRGWLGGKPLRVPLSFAVNPLLLQKESLLMKKQRRVLSGFTERTGTVRGLRGSRGPGGGVSRSRPHGRHREQNGFRERPGGRCFRSRLCAEVQPRGEAPWLPHRLVSRVQGGRGPARTGSDGVLGGARVGPALAPGRPKAPPPARGLPLQDRVGASPHSP